MSGEEQYSGKRKTTLQGCRLGVTPAREEHRSNLQIALVVSALFLFLFAQIVAAEPPLPPSTPDLQTLPPTVTIDRPLHGAAVNLTTTIMYSHSSSAALACTLYVDNAPLRNATFTGTRTEALVFSAGQHQAYVACASAGFPYLSDLISFTATANGTNTTPTNTTVTNTTTSTSAGVMILVPQSSTPRMNLSFNHTAVGPVYCRIYNNGSLAQQLINVPRNVTTTVTFSTPFPVGMRRFDVNCSNVTWNGSATLMINLQYPFSAIGNVTVYPAQAFSRQNVTISGRMSTMMTVELLIVSPLGLRETRMLNTTSDGSFSTEYAIASNARAGMYALTAYAAAERGVMTNGSFQVVARSPSVMLEGNVTNVSTGQPVVVSGSQFIENDNITLMLIGGGSTQTQSVLSDDVGSFTFEYPPLTAQTYQFIARSTADSSLMGSFYFVVSVAPLEVIDETDVPLDPELPPEQTEYPDDGVDPLPEQPYVPPYVPSDPVLEQPSEVSSGWSWWFVPIALLLLFGGLFGFLVYNRSIDVSSGEAFMQSLQDLMGGGPPKSAVSHEQGASIRSFIEGERAKGFDDLTIRNALIGNGWHAGDVDRVFDALYKGK